jgi:hypothetical protein
LIFSLGPPAGPTIGVFGGATLKLVGTIARLARSVSSATSWSVGRRSTPARPRVSSLMLSISPVFGPVPSPLALSQTSCDPPGVTSTSVV